MSGAQDVGRSFHPASPAKCNKGQKIEELDFGRWSSGIMRKLESQVVAGGEGRWGIIMLKTLGQHVAHEFETGRLDSLQGI